MRKYLAIPLLCCLLAVVSCSRQVGEADYAPKRIELKSSEDQFLRNFIAVDNEQLTVSINRNDALFAGATGTGYDDLMRQIGRINASPEEIDRDYWERQTWQRQMQTKVSASFEGNYDKHHVLERDMFLEHFIYAESGEVLLKISEERAVLCGATAEGFRTIRGEVEELNRMVQTGEADYVEVKECFDAKRGYIVEANRPSLFGALPGDTPPKTYGGIVLPLGLVQDSKSFYGADYIDANIHCNDLFSSAVLIERETGKKVVHRMGYNTKGFFKAGLTYPEGGYYYFTLTKLGDSFDASAYFIEHREGN